MEKEMEKIEMMEMEMISERFKNKIMSIYYLAKLHIKHGNVLY